VSQDATRNPPQIQIAVWQALIVCTLFQLGTACARYDLDEGTLTSEPYAPLVPSVTTSTQVIVPAPSGQPIVTLESVSPEFKQAWRFGFSSSTPIDPDYWASALGATWYLDWTVAERPPSEKIEHWQMVRVSEDGFKPDLGTVEAVARSFPGRTWVIGNEPDVIWQDNTSPETYARSYYEIYTAIKSVDPISRIAVAGVAQGTPLRLAYLDRVLETYEEYYGKPMPVDVWTLHGYVLREERGSWGVDIPPGLNDDNGMLYEVSDHGRLDLFEAQIRAFRTWMEARGYRDRPLILTEFGILMPNDYGFPPDEVVDYMLATFDLLLTMRDEETGLPWDENRLVQRWAWFSLYDEVYPTSNLADLGEDRLTELGWAYREYIQDYPEKSPGAKRPFFPPEAAFLSRLIQELVEAEQ